MIYKVKVDGKEIIYGPLITRSHFSDKEWIVIYKQMVKENYPDLYSERKNDKAFLVTMGQLIDMGERYEALLELLPQTAFSKAGTHPKWVADAVAENTLDKGITQDDVKMFLDHADDLVTLKKELTEYFKLKKMGG